MNQLDQLKKETTIVADTGEIDEIKKYHPTDATTNPSLILKASEIQEYQPLIEEAIVYGKSQTKHNLMEAIIAKIFVNFGVEILKYIPGRISTEVDARLSFDVAKSIEKAHQYIDLYKKAGIEKEQILIKIAATWEGILAAKELEKEGIHCNMTLMFSLAQAIACGDAKATLISPFVGRILDWYQQKEGKKGYLPDHDPGVVSVTQIFNYYKKFGYQTQIMGASFRSKDQVVALAGCDLLTIAPKLLQQLTESEELLSKKLCAEKALTSNLQKTTIDEKTFRWLLNEDAMATEKLAEGIRYFARDTIKLEKIIEQRL